MCFVGIHVSFMLFEIIYIYWFPSRYFHIKYCSCGLTITRWLILVEQELPTRPGHLSSSPILVGFVLFYLPASVSSFSCQARQKRWTWWSNLCVVFPYRQYICRVQGHIFQQVINIPIGRNWPTLISGYILDGPSEFQFYVSSFTLCHMIYFSKYGTDFLFAIPLSFYWK